VAKKGRPPKSGNRKPCGRLAEIEDAGHPLVLQHRAAEVGKDLAHSRFAGYVLGRLYLDGVFGKDEDRAERRHDILRDYADFHRLIFGAGTAQSTMAALDGIRGRQPESDADPLAGLYARLKRWSSALRGLRASPGCRLLTRQVVDRAVLYEIPPGSAAEVLTLVRAADRLLSIGGGRLESSSRTRGKRPKTLPRSGENLGAHPSRRDRLALFQRYVPSEAEVSGWLALSAEMAARGASRDEVRRARDDFWSGRLAASPPQGEAD
jgi:hypothetical protein